MIAVGVGDQGAVDGFPRVDIEIACGAINAVICKCEDISHGLSIGPVRDRPMVNDGQILRMASARAGTEDVKNAYVHILSAEVVNGRKMRGFHPLYGPDRGRRKDT